MVFIEPWSFPSVRYNQSTEKRKNIQMFICKQAKPGTWGLGWKVPPPPYN